MAKISEKTKELWAGWTRDALKGYSPPDDASNNEIVDDMVEISISYADDMLEEYEGRFEGGDGRRRRKPADDD
jgi:hypothetical protein